MCTLADFAWMDLLPEHRHFVETELADWHDYYLPVNGAVLDVGAGCGETAFFYLNHGATHVYAIEADGQTFDKLVANISRSRAMTERVTAIHNRITKVKIDIEGAEESLDLETHFPEKWQLMRDAGTCRQWRLIRDGEPFQMIHNPKEHVTCR